MAKKTTQTNSTKNSSVQIVLVGLIILGIINTIGIYWGKEGLIAVGIGILIAIGIMMLIALNMN